MLIYRSFRKSYDDDVEESLTVYTKEGDFPELLSVCQLVWNSTWFGAHAVESDLMMSLTIIIIVAVVASAALSSFPANLSGVQL